MMKYPDKVRNIKVTKGEKNPKNMSICLPRTRTRARAHEVYYTNQRKTILFTFYTGSRGI